MWWGQMDEQIILISVSKMCKWHPTLEKLSHNGHFLTKSMGLFGEVRGFNLIGECFWIGTSTGWVHWGGHV